MLVWYSPNSDDDLVKILQSILEFQRWLGYMTLESLQVTNACEFYKISMLPPNK